MIVEAQVTINGSKAAIWAAITNIENASEIIFETFFSQAPAMHPKSSLIIGVVCGVRVEEIEDPLMQKIRYLDKLIDELAKGKAMDKILRQ